MLLRGKATATAKSPGGLLSRQATFTTTPVIQNEPLETIKDLDNKFLARVRSLTGKASSDTVRSKSKFTNKEVTDFIKDKIEAINELDDF